MYKVEKIGYDQVPQFSHTDRAYQLADPNLRSFYCYTPELSSFKAAIEDRKKYPVDRELLVNTLLEQYSDKLPSYETLTNIESLKSPNTYTIVTAHQPSLLTGPLYFIYKICSVISLSRTVQEENPDCKIVPVFVMGGEDHDFDEISSLQMFSKKFSWSTDQKGSVGRMSLDGISQVIEEVVSTFGNMPFAQDLSSMLQSHYDASKSYGELMIRFVNELCGKYGLVVINMDHPALKERLVDLVCRDIKEHISQHKVQTSQEQLAELGFKNQAYVREINIFFMTDDRHRVIENDNGTYSIDSKLFTREELLEKIKSNPGSISPNVILRPLYQEKILPNLAYVGGGGELAYWLERKEQFEAFEVFYPILIRRDSIMIMDKKSHQFLVENKISLAELFGREEQIMNHLASRLSTIEIDFSPFKSQLAAVFDQIKDLTEQVDPTLGHTVMSEATKAEKGIDFLENKVLKAEKSKNETQLSKASKIKSRYFPGNDSLQERTENFMPFYLKNGPEWLESLVNILDPLDKNFKILIEE